MKKKKKIFQIKNSVKALIQLEQEIFVGALDLGLSENPNMFSVLNLQIVQHRYQ